MKSEALFPNTKLSRKECYELAWSLLLHDNTATASERAHAKCWLTYRTFEGEVKIEDWKAQIEPVQDTNVGPDRARWWVSQMTAEIYLAISKRNWECAWAKAKELMGSAESTASANPSLLLNLLRVHALSAYDDWIHRRDDAAKATAQRGIALWQKIMGSFNAYRSPLRLAEMKTDHEPLMMLAFLHWRLASGNPLYAPWISERDLFEKSNKTPWVICVRIVGSQSVGIPEAGSFENMAWLFNCSLKNRGIVCLNFDEAALLWRLAKKATVGILEIGRLAGGSTCILAGASNVPVLSVDIRDGVKSECRAFLDQRANVELMVHDSKTAPLGDRKFDLIFIDGDHSYEGVKADFNHVLPSLAPGGVIAFHDAVPQSLGVQASVQKFCEELLVAGQMVRIAQAESLLAVANANDKWAADASKIRSSIF